MVVESRVGIVIPAYNAGTYVLEAADSAVAALGSQANVVIVDDGSTDKDSVAAIAELQGRGFRVIRQANRGVSVARNAGIASLSVPYVLTLDADDLVHPTAPTIAADILDTQDDVAIVTGTLLQFNERNERVAYPPSPDASRDGMRHETKIHICSFFRREDWARTEGFPARVRYGEDWVFWMRLLGLRDRIHCSETVFYHRRMHVGQVTAGYIDPRQSAIARKIVMRENPDLVVKYVDEFINEFSITLETLAAYRYGYRNLDRGKSRIKIIMSKFWLNRLQRGETLGNRKSEDDHIV